MRAISFLQLLFSYPKSIPKAYCLENIGEFTYFADRKAIFFQR